MTSEEAAPDPIYGDDAEAAMRNLLDTTFAGDGAKLWSALSSEAYVDILHILKGVGDIGELKSYEVDGGEIDGDDFKFQVRFQSDTDEVATTTTMRKVKGAWSIAAIKVPGIRE